RRREFHVSNKLEGPAFNFAKNRTQDLMTLRNNVQALLEELNIELSFETKTIADVVRGCIWFQLLDKPQRRLISRCRPGTASLQTRDARLGLPLQLASFELIERSLLRRKSGNPFCQRLLISFNRGDWARILNAHVLLSLTRGGNNGCLRLQALAESGKPMQSLHCCFVIETKIQQARQIIHSGRCQLFDECSAFFRGAEKGRVIKITLKNRVKQPLHFRSRGI